jgi:signal transduction histidine kinase/DNA-binding response OmpR family regulator/HAMP domain-containing protein
VSRVAREVGTDGKLGGQARVPGVAGTWKDLTDNVNAMAENLTNQVRGIAQVVGAVAKGDLKRKVVFEAKGEIAAMADTINGMIDTLATFGDQVTNVAREVGIEGQLGGQARVPGAAGLWRDLTDNVNAMAANLTTQVRAIADVATAVTKGDLTRSITVEALGEVAALKDYINEMIRNLKETTLKNKEQDWLKTNLANFSRMLQGHDNLAAVSKLVLSELAPLVNAQQGVFYAQVKRDDEPRLELLASYATKSSKHLPKTLRIGEGLVGQCAVERKRIVLEQAPNDFVRVSSVLGSAAPQSIIILPVLFDGEVKAVIELATTGRFSASHLSFLDQLTESIGIVFNRIEANVRTAALLEQSQSLTGELQSQQAELKKTNDRLAQQAADLQNSERLLKKQQEELQHANESLQEKAMLLSEQMTQVEYKNREVEQARSALEDKAEQLALSSRYKSQFLANMSHELRTPLNSLLILAKLLADNAGNNLSPKQIDYAQAIYAAGVDLLSLINDILDLAKIESGTVSLDFAPLKLSELRDYVERAFREIAAGKGLGFEVEVDPRLPATLLTDEKRLQQILKNLLSNAFKFTEKGRIALRIAPAGAGDAPAIPSLAPGERAVAFTVADTGIGIPENKHKVIFEAFQQADGTTSRQFGGTGLGLSISRELAHLLGGEIQVRSVPGKGSTFTLYLKLAAEPRTTEAPAVAPAPAQAKSAPPRAGRAEQARARLRDDREGLRPGDRVLLIVEDDARFATTLLELARESGFKGVVAADGGSALALARELHPDAITLDLKLPDLDGWTILDILKRDAETRHIPVCVVSADDRRHRCLYMGAHRFVQKPAAVESLQAALATARELVDREVRKLLVADGEQARRADISESLRAQHVEITLAATGRQVLELLSERSFDCMVLGPSLQDTGPSELLKSIVDAEGTVDMPVVVYGANGLGGRERDSLDQLAEIVVLRKADTIDAILDQATLFLHQALDALPEGGRERLASLAPNAELAGKTVLIVDDDVRNIFALTGALEEHGMKVLSAETGKEALEVLKGRPAIDAVLMDIMMPELDGYDTIRIIRGLEQFAELPIVAVTAKAMPEDREKCLQAGASDYIAKPVNIEQLSSLLRIWLSP